MLWCSKLQTKFCRGTINRSHQSEKVRLVQVFQIQKVSQYRLAELKCLNKKTQEKRQSLIKTFLKMAKMVILKTIWSQMSPKVFKNQYRAQIFKSIKFRSCQKLRKSQTKPVINSKKPILIHTTTK